jgi:hypothetical protein
VAFFFGLWVDVGGAGGGGESNGFSSKGRGYEGVVVAEKITMEGVEVEVVETLIGTGGS